MHFDFFLLKLDQNEDSFAFLIEANNKSEWLWSVYFKYLMGGFFANMMVAAIISGALCYILSGHLDVDILYHPYKLM